MDPSVDFLTFLAELSILLGSSDFLKFRSLSGAAFYTSPDAAKNFLTNEFLLSGIFREWVALENQVAVWLDKY